MTFGTGRQYCIYGIAVQILQTIISGKSYDVFTLADSDADKKWVVENCVQVFIPTPTPTQRDNWVSNPFCQCRCRCSVSVSVSDSVNTP